MDATQLRVRYSDDCATVEREIRQVTDVTEEDLETTEGKDVAGGLVRGGQKTRRKRRSYLDCCLIKFVEPGLRFFHKPC